MNFNNLELNLKKKLLFTVLQLFTPVVITIIACNTIKPAIIAFVVAIAGMIFPAIAVYKKVKAEMKEE